VLPQAITRPIEIRSHCCRIPQPRKPGARGRPPWAPLWIERPLASHCQIPTTVSLMRYSRTGSARRRRWDPLDGVVGVPAPKGVLVSRRWRSSTFATQSCLGPLPTTGAAGRLWKLGRRSATSNRSDVRATPVCAAPPCCVKNVIGAAWVCESEARDQPQWAEAKSSLWKEVSRTSVCHNEGARSVSTRPDDRPCALPIPTLSGSITKR